MNISQPVPSAVDSVEFSFLSTEEIHAISVKQVNNDTTFDTLLNPSPGGLYDPSLGSWGDALCATCNLGQSACPGHPGHIDLPAPVYHPVFMDQVLRLLRAQCANCHRFRLRRRDLHRYECLFRLLQHGLIAEAQSIDAIGENYHGLAAEGIPQDVVNDSDDDDNGDSVIRARDAYVRKSLARLRLNLGEVRKNKHEGASEMRSALTGEFFKEIVKTRQCATCRAIAPKYRKDRFVKIFETPLSAKELAKNTEAGIKQRDAVLASQKPKSRNKGGYESDEGIADLDSLPSDEEQSVNADEGEGDELDEVGNVVSGSTRKGSKSNASAPPHRYLTPVEVRSRLRLLFHNEQDLLSLVYSRKPTNKKTGPLTPDIFFLDAILVPPNRYRPEARTGDAQVTEAQQNSLYKLILRSSTKFSSIYADVHKGRVEGGSFRQMSSLHEAWTELQDCVNSLIDKTKNPVQGAAAKRNEDGIKQKLEKKEGLFRKNMMGKRVNYAARSVISPDPNIETNEIGVPPVFARKLTYPEPVTSHNFKDMQQAVINGVDKWPGASAIENENGQIINLRNKSLEERISLANQLLAPTNNNFSGMRNKKVHRHLTNGDVVLMNRQPTLHKPSIMGHRVRVLPGEKTIRMHYANCNTYNADFDGDEMNMHFPQNEIARAEALQLADTDHQYISGTAGKPLRGLIQDHLSVSVALCNRDTFFDKGAYHQLIYSALRPESGHVLGERIELVPPAILKPAPRWTGKQVITTILKNIKPPNCGELWMNGKSSIPAGRWGQNSEEGVVLFRDGEFISGILDKAQLGPSSGGFIHSVHEVYGPAVAGKLLSSMGRLLTRYLTMRAFTCGMDDLKLTREGEKWRRQKLEAARHIGLEVAAKYVTLDEQKPLGDDPELLNRLEEVMRDDTKQEGLDLLMNKNCLDLSSDITKACLPNGLEKQFPKNQMQSMTTSGAKGSPVNANLISCNLGQQVLEGRRVPVMVSGKTLPCFRPFDTNVRAGGYIVNRFLTGIRPQEYYFHHMAGREGLIDTAVKTSRSGYLQRCLIKGMEGLGVAYDTSVRDSDGTMVQFLFGEDGLDITKQKYLTDFGFLLQNFESQLAQTRYHDATTYGLFEHKEDLFKKNKLALKKAKANMINTDAPSNCLVDPATHAFATSEKFFGALADYIKENRDGIIREKGEKQQIAPGRISLSKKQVEKVMAAKYMRSLVEPGEAVGIVAGQSVGEPSTQMTLNTFHLAGHSAKNVTLGIPRLREILMTASDRISTPSMTLILNEELGEEEGREFAKSISVLPLSHVLDKATVRERVGKGIAYPLAKIYDIRLNFFSSEEYTSAYCITTMDVLDTVEKKLLPNLQGLITREIKKKKGSDVSAATPEIGVKAGVVEMARPNTDTSGGAPGDDDDDDDDGDDDATNAKQKANRSEAVSYGPNDEDDDAIQTRLEREASPIDDDEPEDEGFGGSPPPELPKDDDDEALSGAEGETSGRSRESRVKSKNPHVSQFQCDNLTGEWCAFTLEFDVSIPKLLMLNLVQEAVRKSLVHQVPGIGHCTFVADEKVPDPQTGQDIKMAVVHTNGVNLQAMQNYGGFINPNRISTNDISAVLKSYGVEACRSNIIRELSNVFGSHGISVDNRHLNLIGDYMTRNGGFTPFNRMGLKGNVSPFTKMSFETTLAFLKDALLDGDWDNLASPSSRLVMGRLGKVGTGAFDVLTRVPQQHFDPLRPDLSMEA